MVSWVFGGLNNTTIFTNKPTRKKRIMNTSNKVERNKSMKSFKFSCIDFKVKKCYNALSII